MTSTLHAGAPPRADKPSPFLPAKLQLSPQISRGPLGTQGVSQLPPLPCAPRPGSRRAGQPREGEEESLCTCYQGPAVCICELPWPPWQPGERKQAQGHPASRVQIQVWSHQELRLLSITVHTKQKDSCPPFKGQAHRHRETLSFSPWPWFGSSASNRKCELSVFSITLLPPGPSGFRFDLEGFCRLTFGAGVNRGQDC